MTRLLGLAALLAMASAPIAEWPFPGLGVPVESSVSSSDVVRLPGSPVVFHQSDLDSGTRAIDWFPQSHPSAPDVVLRNGTADDAYPCGYCHLSDGRGRPENASLQGLPADYIVEQVKAFSSGARKASSPAYAPTLYMIGVAHALSSKDLDAAAAYFTQFEPQSHTRVVEASTIPAATAWHFVYRFDSSRQEALGQRIVEGPIDRQRFELRDPETAYIAYVPMGAKLRGKAIAEKGASGGPACVSCHGKALAGIAGASPTYLARQLMSFRDKTRNDADAAPMQTVAARLSDKQIVDIAAFIGGRPPWRHADMPDN